MKSGTAIWIMAMALVLMSCEIENPFPDPVANPENTRWIIPKMEIILRSDKNDSVPAIENPKFVPVFTAGHMNPGDMILGVGIKGEYRAYPVAILNYHEVVNEVFPSGKKMISYCPLSGSSSAWDSNLQGISTSFGVSRYLYNSHHVLYDRISMGHWLPLKYLCVNGQLEGLILQEHQLVETTWKYWSEMFPGSKVLIPPAGSAFDYFHDPFLDYTSKDSVYFPVNPLNLQLPVKTKVHGIIVDKYLKVYPLEVFGDTTSILHDNFQGLSVIVVGNRLNKYVVSFERRIGEGPELNFTSIQGSANVLMADQEGNKYDIFGLVVEGPKKGQSLNPTRSIRGYWFALAATYRDPLIYK